MEEVAKLFSIAMPIFAILIVGEKLYGYVIGKDTVPWIDAVASAYSGITLAVRSLFGLGFTLVTYDFIYQNFAIFYFEKTWIVYLFTFIAIDFQFYWGHRLSHRVNVLWNKHLIHHSSEEFNIACSMRQPALDLVNFLFFLSIPTAVIGISPLMIAFILPFHKLAQVWYHTRLIGKLGILERIIVTPSQHRVHHALNPIYIDKNYSAVFNVWDKIFGTFQEELETEPPVYGITKPSQTYNPITINVEHLMLLIKDAWRAEKFWDKLTIWFRPTGWRPEGFNEIYPIQTIKNHYKFSKFSPELSSGVVIWSLFQFFMLFGVVLFALYNITLIGKTGAVALAVFVFVQVYSATELMNKNKFAPIFALISTFTSIAIYFIDPTFFGLDKLASFLPQFFFTYFIIQSLLALKFSYNSKSLIFNEC